VNLDCFREDRHRPDAEPSFAEDQLERHMDRTGNPDPTRAFCRASSRNFFKTRPSFKNRTMRYRFFVSLIALEVLALVYLVATGHFSAARVEPVRRHNQKLVQELVLTDLAIWTGARYTRHLSQADVFSAFQDGLGALERFPEGALAPLPALIRPSRPAAAQAHREAGDEPTS
jgi:hypothetical protein